MKLIFYLTLPSSAYYIISTRPTEFSKRVLEETRNGIAFRILTKQQDQRTEAKKALLVVLNTHTRLS
jgi:hypothetical protein